MNRYEEFSCRSSGKTEKGGVQWRKQVYGKSNLQLFSFFCMENILYNNAIDQKKKGMPKTWLEAFR